ncbi:MAG: hypothetical protein CL670_04835 [Balneola sp.]|jgi:hypothetical protein|nr:hypothetical protein [Balneola sp.]MBE78457.1 hypothetical protein [Balneola sp.]|tara:strand:- start:895 stop:1161 length:267 start_codon:yes stop_codon:yes gene_type:complete
MDDTKDISSTFFFLEASSSGELQITRFDKAIQRNMENFKSGKPLEFAPLFLSNDIGKIAEAIDVLVESKKYKKIYAEKLKNNIQGREN